MFGVEPGPEKPQNIVFVLVQNFSMIAFASAIEPLRAANRLEGKQLYSWCVAGGIGRNPVPASNGSELVPSHGLDELEAPRCSVVIICAGVRVEEQRNEKLESWLRARAREGAAIGGVCTGAFILARAGILDGHRCTIHWENIEGFVEHFPDHLITTNLFEIDRKRFSCSGGTAPLDMMLSLVAEDFGDDLARRIADQMVHARLRYASEEQLPSFGMRSGVTHPKLLAALARMETLQETRIILPELARSVGLSLRQLERLFTRHLGKSPHRYYLEMRLRHAQNLLNQTSMSIIQIAVTCGFSSASHFARSYRLLFGHAPRAARTLRTRIEKHTTALR